jgi:hypothetical protein
MREYDLLHAAVEPAIARGPIEPGITMVILSEAERKVLVELLAGMEKGPGASARIKLRAAAPVRDAELGSTKWTGLKRIFMALFDTDGREKGQCRWCEKTARIDQYGLCTHCLPRHRKQQQQQPQSALCEI